MIVWAAISEAVELIDVRVILFSVAFTVQVGKLVNPVPATFAHVALEIDIVTSVGTNILIFPSDVRGSMVIRVIVYDVFVFTTESYIATDPDTVLSRAVMVVVPSIFGYPSLRIVKVNTSVGLIDGGAVKFPTLNIILLPALKVLPRLNMYMVSTLLTNVALEALTPTLEVSVVESNDISVSEGKVTTKLSSWFIVSTRVKSNLMVYSVFTVKLPPAEDVMSMELRVLGVRS